MKALRQPLLLIALLTFSCHLFSQENTVLSSVPGTKEEFVSSEKAVINTVTWLENTPLNQEVEKRKQLYALLVAWLTNSPTVTIEVNAKVVTFTKKNADLLIIFMGGWTKYSLENSYSKDNVLCNLAGIKSAIKVYKMGNGMKKDKEMEKLIALEEKGELEKWVKDQLEKK